MRSVRFPLRSLVSSARASSVSPGRLPSSISALRTQSRSVSSATPRSFETALSDRPVSRYNFTASALNSGGYGGLDGPGMWTPFPWRASSLEVSTEAGQAHFGLAPLPWTREPPDAVATACHFRFVRQCQRPMGAFTNLSGG